MLDTSTRSLRKILDHAGPALSEPIEPADLDELAGRKPIPHTPPPTTIEDILSTRAKTHGDFADTARISQDMKRIVQSEVGWDKLSDVQREVLQMIMTKIARIVSGNPNVKDHWLDISGYAKLAAERIREDGIG